MKSTKCQQCGFVGFGSSNCKSCGASLESVSHYNYQPAFDDDTVKKGLAVLGLVLGILGFFTAGLILIGSVIGIIVSVKAMRLARDQPWAYGGRSLAIAGLVLNITAVTSFVPTAIVAAIAIPNIFAARMAANEAYSIRALRSLHSAEATYFANRGSYGTMQNLLDNQLVEPTLASGMKNGYKFKIELIERDVTNPARFELTAVPETYRSSGMRSFYVDDTGVVHAADTFGGPATKADPALGTLPREGSLTSEYDGPSRPNGLSY